MDVSLKSLHKEAGDKPARVAFHLAAQPLSDGSQCPYPSDQWLKLGPR